MWSISVEQLIFATESVDGSQNSGDNEDASTNIQADNVDLSVTTILNITDDFKSSSRIGNKNPIIMFNNES